jgi:hypothetical protein
VKAYNLPVRYQIKSTNNVGKTEKYNHFIEACGALKGYFLQN